MPKEHRVSTFSNPLTEYSPQLEFAREPLPELEEESGRGVFEESQEFDLAAGMLEVTNEDELDNFLDDVVRQAGAAIGSDTKPGNTRAIADVLKKATHQILSSAGMDQRASSSGSLGGQLGRGLSTKAGELLGLELEGLSPEDREFEAARQFLRFAGQTVKHAVEDSSRADPSDVARRAATEAAGAFAPGLFSEGRHVPGDSGCWISCHDRIILFGM